MVVAPDGIAALRAAQKVLVIGSSSEIGLGIVRRASRTARRATGSACSSSDRKPVTATAQAISHRLI